ncbi:MULTISPECIES: YlcI/YnfO family protein [Eubacteriales]|uniref:YlcI/YnfO family protein n=1 Tax=Eubacteriales TaxID=186802 RepID=UPI002570EFE4|nr:MULTISPECIES: YlcI/YnfO family protein [Eubacteriales]
MGRFQIPSTPPTINKTIRFPSDVVEGVEKAIQNKNCTFSAFVIAAVRAALEEVREIDTSSPDQHP